jgi:hypothetical protein
MYALNVVAGMALLLGHPVMAHLGMPSSIPARWQNLSILFICGCMCGLVLPKCDPENIVDEFE